MKKLLYLVMAAAMGFAACSDQNEVVDGIIDGVKDRPIIHSFPYTLTTADYGTISSAAVRDAGDNAANRALAEAVRSTNSLNSFADPLKYIPTILGPKYPALGLESAIQVTYAYTPDYLANLSANPPAANLTTLLAEDFEEGYSDIITSFPYSKWDRKGWTNIVTVGGGQKYHRVRSRSGAGTYHEVTSNGNPAEETEAYVISPEIDLSQTTDNNFSFDLVVAHWNFDGLKVLITEDANCLTTPATVTWRDITASFNIPQVPVAGAGYGPMQTAGRYNLDTDYAGKKIYIAFRYNGSNDPVHTTTYQIDNVLVASGRVIDPQPGEVYIDDPEQGWTLYPNGIALVAADYTAMGLTSLSAAQAPNYLPTWLAGKFPYAQEKDRKAVLYSGGRDEYIFTGGKWVPTLVGAPVTEQYVNDGTKWIFDPTINYTMTTADHKMMVDYMLADPELAVFANQQYRNEEFYYGFGSRYTNVSFRFSYRMAEPYFSADPEYHKLDNNPEAQLAFLWNRLEQEGMPLFLTLRFPDAPAITQGVQQHYNITVAIHSPDDGVTNFTRNYRLRYKVLTAGSTGNPPTFEHVSSTAL